MNCDAVMLVTLELVSHRLSGPHIIVDGWSLSRIMDVAGRLVRNQGPAAHASHSSTVWADLSFQSKYLLAALHSEATTACAVISAMTGDGEGLATADHVLRWSATTEVACLGGVRVRGRSDVAHSS